MPSFGVLIVAQVAQPILASTASHVRGPEVRISPRRVRGAVTSPRERRGRELGQASLRPALMAYGMLELTGLVTR